MAATLQNGENHNKINSKVTYVPVINSKAHLICVVSM